MFGFAARRFIGGAAVGAGLVAGGVGMAQVPQVRRAANDFAHDLAHHAAQGGVAGAAHAAQQPAAQQAVDATAKRAGAAARKGAIGF